VHSNVVTVFIIEHVISAIAIAAVLSTALSLPGFQLNAAWINVYVSCADADRLLGQTH
jgi:hypothetical protein